MSKKLNLIIKNNRIYTDSRSIAEATGMTHESLYSVIDRYVVVLANKLDLENFFLKSSYKDNSGRRHKCYLLTSWGCNLVKDEITGDNADEFRITFNDQFYEMKNQIMSKRKIMRIYRKSLI